MKTTSAVYVTGTIDPRLVEHDLEYAWQYLGYWFNMFLANLRKHCLVASDDNGEKANSTGAKIRVFRSWESHESGWPHFHAILCFEGYSWPIFQDAGSKWRLEDKRVFEDAWSYGWIDVLALTPGTAERNTEKMVRYVSKYVATYAPDADCRYVHSWPVKRLLTEAVLWYYGKRSYSISRNLIREADCGADDLKKRTSTIQTNLEGGVEPGSEIKWEFVGLVRRKDTELSADGWIKLYSEPPDWLDACWKPRSSRAGLGWADSWGNWNSHL